MLATSVTTVMPVAYSYSLPLLATTMGTTVMTGSAMMMASASTICIGKYGRQERHAHEAGVAEDETELEYAILIVFDAHELRDDEHQQAYDRVEERG